MLLIGPGGDGNGTTDGGSGGVTVWYGSALNVPDTLNIRAGASIASTGTSTEVVYRTANTVNTLLKANAASGSTAGTAETAGVFAASGFYQSIAGQSGSASSPSSTTFLTAGGGFTSKTANYGYGIGNDANGFFMLQPIIVGMGGSNSGRGGIGCGGGSASGVGGPGMVLIASW